MNKMENNKYSNKELAIFEGLMNLIKEGANLYSITVSEIAKAADVGKGTIYDYFKTKEEAISKAIIYSIDNEVKDAINRIEIKDGFKRKYYEILNIIAENLKNRFCTINMLLSTGGFEEFYEYLIDEQYSMPLYITKIEKEIYDFLKLGFEEGIITSTEDRYYKIMVIKSSISAFGNYINIQERYPETSIEKAMDLSYKMVIKSLN